MTVTAPEFIGLPSFVLVLVALLFFWDETWGVLTLLSGFVLFDRNFAYTHLQIGSWPLYLTEVALVAWILNRLFHSPRLFWQRLQALPKGFWTAVIVYWAAGLISFVRGGSGFPLVHVLRDSALCYYSLFMILAATGEWSPKQLKQMGTILLGLALLRAVVVLNFDLETLFQTPALMYGQPAAFSMFFSLVILYLLSARALALSAVYSIAIVILTSAILIATVRSSWTGLTAGMLVLFCLYSLVLPKNLLVRRLFSNALVLLVIPWCLLALSSKLQYSSGARAVVANTSPVIDQILLPKSVGVPPSSSPGGVASSNLDSFASSSPKVFAPKSIPYIAPAVPPIHRVSKEFASFSQGLDSNNVMTRLWMWRDVLWEVLAIKLFSPDLQKSDLKHYHLPDPPEQAPPGLLMIRIDADGLRDQHLVFHFAQPGRPTFTATQIWTKRTEQFLFGVSFGKPFLPPEVIWLVNSPYRYDPHNSLVHIFYRMGFLGLLAFLAIVYNVAKSGLALVRHASSDTFYFRLCAGALSGLAYFLIHAMTDNVLENPFKSIWFWIPCGLVMAIARSSHQKPVV